MKLILAILLVSFSSVAQTSARIPPVEIARVVNANRDQFRTCYDQGRARNPRLTGRVSTRFVIDASGAVSSAASEPSTTMPDVQVIACVVSTFQSLKFPAPHGGGDMTVTYPFDFHD
jgi:TonB family protein